MNKKLLPFMLALIIVSFSVLAGCNNMPFINNSATESETPSASSKKETAPSTAKTHKKSSKKTEKTKSKKTKKTTKSEPDSKPENKRKDIVVVLDAGHDSTTHTRNHPNLGVNEQDLNFKIVKAAYDRLTEYKGVTVYRSRPDGTCPIVKYNCSYVKKYPEPCIRARTDFAERKKADLFVSFHCNASSGNLGASANGTEVYVSKHPKYYTACKNLGSIILDKIDSSVDVQTKGVLTRSKPEKGHYPNGTVKDFYYLISNNIDNGRPGIIIEHAYMDNSHDNAILKNDANLKKFGIADADAIAEYYGLSLK